MITLRQASIVVDAALAFARGREMPPMTVAVLDPAGMLVAFKKEDGSSLLRQDIARGKAWGALALGIGSRAIATRAEKHPNFVAAISTLAGGLLVPVPGGVLIRETAGGTLLGAVGISGDLSDKDEACALAGIEAAGLFGETG